MLVHVYIFLVFQQLYIGIDSYLLENFILLPEFKINLKLLARYLT